MVSDIPSSTAQGMDTALLYDLGATNDSAESSRAGIKRGSNLYVLNNVVFI